jgi:hypothetical protein
MQIEIVPQPGHVPAWDLGVATIVNPLEGGPELHEQRAGGDQGAPDVRQATGKTKHRRRSALICAAALCLPTRSTKITPEPGSACRLTCGHGRHRPGIAGLR